MGSLSTAAPSSPEFPPFVCPPIVESLPLEELEPGRVHRLRLVLTQNATGNETLVPTFVARASDDGSVVGITSAIHGNELNGIRVIHELLSEIGGEGLALRRGTLIAVPILNVPGYLNNTRDFSDGVDLNRIMPGRADGNESELYAHRILERIVRHCDYLIDLHTANLGRVNTHYVRCAGTSRMCRQPSSTERIAMSLRLMSHLSENSRVDTREPLAVAGECAPVHEDGQGPKRCSVFSGEERRRVVVFGAHRGVLGIQPHHRAVGLARLERTPVANPRRVDDVVVQRHMVRLGTTSCDGPARAVPGSPTVPHRTRAAHHSRRI